MRPLRFIYVMALSSNCKSGPCPGWVLNDIHFLCYLKMANGLHLKLFLNVTDKVLYNEPMIHSSIHTQTTMQGAVLTIRSNLVLSVSQKDTLATNPVNNENHLYLLSFKMIRKG